MSKPASAVSRHTAGKKAAAGRTRKRLPPYATTILPNTGTECVGTRDPHAEPGERMPVMPENTISPGALQVAPDGHADSIDDVKACDGMKKLFPDGHRGGGQTKGRRSDVRPSRSTRAVSPRETAAMRTVPVLKMLFARSLRPRRYPEPPGSDP